MQLGQERELQRKTLGQNPSLDSGIGITFASRCLSGLGRGEA